MTGSYGGEVGLFSSALVVRGANLHAWVEADLDGEGFTVLDPTPPSGIPPPETRLSWNRMFSNLGHEIEFFYDRRILGFDSLDQVQFLEAARRIVSGLGRSVFLGRSSLGAATCSGRRRVRDRARESPRRRPSVRETRNPPVRRRRADPGLPRSAAALSRRGSVPLASAVPPLAVARLFEKAVPEGEEDARAVVALYCESAFGGRPIDREAEEWMILQARRLQAAEETGVERDSAVRRSPTLLWRSFLARHLHSE